MKVTPALDITAMKEKPRPRVLPFIHERAKRLLQQEKLLFSLLDGLGSPLNVLLPQNIDDNIKSFQDAYKKNNIRGRIFCSSKPNKSRAMLRQASLYDVGLDVSSPQSLEKALGCGFAPARLEATGPKNKDYLLMALQLDILINVDNFEELKNIKAIRDHLGLTRKARVMVRLCGFSSPRIDFTPQDNTFGIRIYDVPEVLQWLVSHKNEIDFTGFSFHFNSTNTEQRLVAIENQLEMTFAALNAGLTPKAINIGGGFDFNYAQSAEEWDEYVDALKRSVLREIPSQTWNNSGLGFRDYDGAVSGGALFSPHYHDKVKGEELDKLLNLRLPQFHNNKIANLISDSLLELYIEPGRSMFDQCGFTIAAVNSVKKSTWGETIINLGMNQSNINAQLMKNLTQSVVLHRNINTNETNDNGLYYNGNLCQSFDILQYNKQYPDFTPKTGDAICFINTASYMMDFNESETLQQPLGKKVAIWEKDNEWHWALDEKYLPLN
jgi:diaminopimelate decarboxylase